MTAAMRIGKQDYTVEGRGGIYKVTLSWYRTSRSAKRWEVSLWRGTPRFIFGLFKRWRWQRMRTEANIRRLVAARHIYDGMREEADALAAGPLVGQEAIA